jgi:hypothetical protein
MEVRREKFNDVTMAVGEWDVPAESGCLVQDLAFAAGKEIVYA